VLSFTDIYGQPQYNAMALGVGPHHQHHHQQQHHHHNHHAAQQQHQQQQHHHHAAQQQLQQPQQQPQPQPPQHHGHHGQHGVGAAGVNMADLHVRVERLLAQRDHPLSLVHAAQAAEHEAIYANLVPSNLLNCIAFDPSGAPLPPTNSDATVATSKCIPLTKAQYGKTCKVQ